MDDHLENWRRRLSLHAVAILLLFGVLLAFRFMVELDGTTPDEVVHRWRMAHLEGLTRSFVLFGLAASLGFFRLPRSTVTFASTVVIFSTWAAVVGAVLTAVWGQHGRGGWTPDTVLSAQELVHHRIVFVFATVATIGTITSLLLIFIRAIWEALREGIFPRTWHNWAKIVALRPREVAEPTTREQLQALLQDAFDANTPVHAFGARASWNEIATSHGVMVSMAALDRVLDLDEAAMTVKVEAGIEMGALSEYLHEQGYALETTPVIPWVQAGGALGTCSHGTGIHHEQFSELVVEMEIFRDLDGIADPLVAIKYVTPDHEWNALLTHLGAMGVVYSVTFTIIEDFDVRFRDIAMPMRPTIDYMLGDLLSREIDTGTERPNMYSEVLWYPYNEDCIVKQWYRTEEIAPPPGFQDLWVDFVQFLQTRLLTPILHFLLSLYPWVTPIVMRFIHDVALREDSVLPLYQGLQYIRRYPRVVAMSYAIPFDPNDSAHGFDEVRKAWYAAVDRIGALEYDGIYPINMVLHARFVKNGHSSLNPAWSPRGEEGYSCHIEVLTAENTPRYEEFFEDLERQWMLMGGRAHWGKLCFAPERIRDTIDPANLMNWENVRLDMDPRARFMNDYLRRILRVPE
jgi:hypothetical protein